MAVYLMSWFIGVFYNFKMRQALKRANQLGFDRESKLRSLRFMTYNDVKIFFDFFKASDQDSFDVNAEKLKIIKYLKIQIYIFSTIFFIAGCFLLAKSNLFN